MKVNILGVAYEIILNATEKEYPYLASVNGFADTSIKKLVVKGLEKTVASYENLEAYSKKVLRHEIIHAFLHESGLDSSSDWARNEEIVDWIALQFEKMLNTFREVKAIGED